MEKRPQRERLGTGQGYLIRLPIEMRKTWDSDDCSAFFAFSESVDFQWFLGYNNYSCEILSYEELE